MILRISIPMLLLISIFLETGDAGARNVTAEDGGEKRAGDKPTNAFWPPYAGDSLSGLGSLEYTSPAWTSPSVQRIAIRPKPIDDDGGWFDETFHLDIYLKSGEVVTKNFYAALGFFQVNTPYRIWGDSYSYVILIRQITKGTGVSEHELDVFEAKDGVVRTVLEKKIAGYFDFFGNLWRYKVFVTPTAIGPTNSFYGLELHYERDFAGEEFAREGFVAKDAAYGQDMPKVICIIYHEETLREYNGKRCRDIRELE